MRTHVLFLAGFCLFVCMILQSGCSEDRYVGDQKTNKPPEVWLSSGPVEGSTTGYQVHFYWGGWDPDGEIVYYEYIVVDGDPFGFNPEDTVGKENWVQTTHHDRVVAVSADENPQHAGGSDTRYDKTHTFFIRAVDQHGLESPPVYRSFTAWTLAPYVEINRPQGACLDLQTLSRKITFGWQGKDPIDLPSNTQDPLAIRYLWTKVVDSTGFYDPTADIVGDLNANPERYDTLWGRWISYRAPEDSGRSTILGDDEPLEMTKHYIFAVQAIDEAGAVTAIFDKCRNVRQFIVTQMAGPLLTVCEPFLGCFKFLGTNFRPEKRDLPPGVPLNFSWNADATSYGGEVKSYRYGWNVADVNDPADWDVLPNPSIRTAPERKLFSGVHTFFVETVDNAETVSLGQIEINIIPFSMERNLLWVDDFYSTDFIQTLWAIPTETQHDSFWVDICRRAEGFSEEDDIYDVAAHNFTAPPISYVGRYKNIIWVYSNEVTAWGEIVFFTPESQTGQGGRLTVNYLSLFLTKGGHLLTCGRSDRGGGVAAMLNPTAQSFPMSLRCEIVQNQEGCEGDTSGVFCQAYKDYCITMVDKIVGIKRIADDMPSRVVRDFDALSFCMRDDNDPITAQYPELPQRLNLWEEVTRSGRYFDPNGAYDRGLTYVEVYDPAYWMDRNYTVSQGCFHPMYRMRARSTLSAIDNGVVMLWVSKYEDIVPDVESGVAVAGKSFHFGFPLWFFNREGVDQIIDVVLDEWGIKKNP